ncbi:C2H2 finger domain-containing protein [Colletotrichum higginsianum]|uniref:C2H2 finger domain-containing protein n=1 Tax=Colletotrichum higginsianum (strain IMI 349063) TaxID=759273 RepID=H1VYZ5_COLHI|nr:C2H2 finger domain-containing protein [Colletotrichum higginsianum]
MRCPAIDCKTEFKGVQAWDERMEHVARHLERAADGKEPTVQFGGENDHSLTDWASSLAVGVIAGSRVTGEWALVNPLKP